MDLNQLLHQHQVALINLGEAHTEDDRMSRFDLVGQYAKRIREFRVGAGLPPQVWGAGDGAPGGRVTGKD
jgi:hypothetical protein